MRRRAFRILTRRSVRHPRANGDPIATSPWVPAFAGMTKEVRYNRCRHPGPVRDVSPVRHPSGSWDLSSQCITPPHEMPAFAGMTNLGEVPSAKGHTVVHRLSTLERLFIASHGACAGRNRNPHFRRSASTGWGVAFHPCRHASESWHLSQQCAAPFIKDPSLPEGQFILSDRPAGQPKGWDDEWGLGSRFRGNDGEGCCSWTGMTNGGANRSLNPFFPDRVRAR